MYEAGALIAVHPLLEGRRQRSVLPGHRSGASGASAGSGAGGEAVACSPVRAARRPPAA